MPKGKKYGNAITVKADGVRAIAGQTGIIGRKLTFSKARETFILQQMKESMNSKPSKENPILHSEAGHELMKMMATIVNNSSYKLLREAKDMANDLSKKLDKSLKDIPIENIKSQDDINKHFASVVGGKEGEMLKKLLEITMGK